MMTDKLKNLIEDELKTAYAQGRKEAEADYHDTLEKVKSKAYIQGVVEGKRINEKGCEGCKYIGLDDSDYPCSCCMNNYRNLWEPEKKDDEIEFGDEVVGEDGEKGFVVSKDNADRVEIYVLINGYDVPQTVFKRNYKRTGKHYDLDAFMEELKI